MGIITDSVARARRRKSKCSRTWRSGSASSWSRTSGSGTSGFRPICSGPRPRSVPTSHLAALRAQADGIPDHVRAALALNILTEEGLPHFHRLLAVYLGDDSHWRLWNNLWTAEEDRHGQVLHDYARDTRLFNQRKIEEMQFEYLRRGLPSGVGQGPYRVFAYTTVQERATQFSHAETGQIDRRVRASPGRGARARSPRTRPGTTPSTAAVFEEILKRDPDQALHSASFILPAIDMPGITIPGLQGPGRGDPAIRASTGRGTT